MTPLTILCVSLGFVLAIAGLFRPFWGLFVFILIHFVQPGELVPALDALRIELVYGVLLIAALIYQGALKSIRSVLSERIVLGAILLLGAAIISVPFAIWLGGAVDAVQELAKLITLVLLFSVLVNSQIRLKSMLWCMVAVGVWFAASSLSAYIHGDFSAVVYDWGTFDRAQGINSMVGGPNELAGLLLALFPILIAVLRCTKNIFLRILLIAAGLLSLFAIGFTGSRIAVIGLVAIAIFYAIQSERRVVTCLACIVVGLLVWTNLPRVYQARYLTLQNYAQGGELDASNELRLEIWKAGGQIFLHSPIVGVGAGQFKTAYGLLYLRGAHAGWMNPHNLLIQVACELGVIGLAAFLYFLWAIFRGIIFVIQKRSRQTELNYQTAIACSVMFVGTVILSIVGHTLFRPYWYLLAGLVIANKRTVESVCHKKQEVAADPEAIAPRRLATSGRKLNVPSRVSHRLHQFRRVHEKETHK